MQGPEIQAKVKTKRRHGCLTAILIFIIVYSVAVIIGYLTGMGVFELPGGPPQWAIPVLIVLLLLQIICITAIFMWKKWGFWGFVTVNIIGLIIDVFLGISLLQPILSVVVGTAILYGVLQIGNDKKGWMQLE